MNNDNINCIKCKNFYITWDKKYPKGCKLFDFKSSRLPSVLVLESTGVQCKHFEKKTKSK